MRNLNGKNGEKIKIWRKATIKIINNLNQIGKTNKSNPKGECIDCLEPIRPSQTQCGNCHADLKQDDRYCRICGTKVGGGAYEPYQDLMQLQCIYGPSPEEKTYVCKKCGYKWQTVVDKQEYCPKCGGDAPVCTSGTV